MSGTTVAPTLKPPQRATTKDQRLGMSSAIRSPGVEPALDERPREAAGAALELLPGERAAVPESAALLGERRAVLSRSDAKFSATRATAGRSFRSIRCQTSAGTRWRGVYAASDGLAVASTPHFAE